MTLLPNKTILVTGPFYYFIVLCSNMASYVNY